MAPSSFYIAIKILELAQKFPFPPLFFGIYLAKVPGDVHTFPREVDRTYFLSLLGNTAEKNQSVSRSEMCGGDFRVTYEHGRMADNYRDSYPSDVEKRREVEVRQRGGNTCEPQAPRHLRQKVAVCRYGLRS